jgi:hypothetical protein
MKAKNIFWTALVAILLISTSCEDAIDKEAFLAEEATPSVLQDLTASSFVLTKPDKDNEFQEFEWTAADYGYKASVQSTIQIDAEGNDFADKVDVVSSYALSASVTVGQFNDFLLAIGLSPESPADIEIRLASNVNGQIVYSNVVTATVTPYATTFPPIWGMGAGLKGWGPWPGNAVELQSSEFKKYETVARFVQGEAFRFFNQLDWGPTSYNYPYFTTVSPLLENALDGDLNFRVVGATGYYKINVDLVAKTVAMVSVPEPVLFMTGSGVNDWNWNPGVYVKLNYVKPGVFNVTHNFITDGAFRFFGQADWGPTGYNYPFFTSVDPMFVNASDGDSNLKVVTGGSSTITVDLNAKTVVKN